MKTILKNYWVLFLLLIAIPGVSRAQMMYADEFFAYVQEQQGRIDLIHAGMQDVSRYLDLDNAEANALETSDPQDYIDFTVARFNRMMSIMNYEIADIAGQIAAFITLHKDDGVISPQVINEGIAKYTDMSNFSLEYATQTQADFERDWEKHFSKYGNRDFFIICEDNDFMRLYGIEIQE